MLINIQTYLDLSFGAGLTADRSDHLTAVHLDHKIINTQNAFMPRTDVYIVVDSRLYMLQVHNVIPSKKKDTKLFPEIPASECLLKPGHWTYWMQLHCGLKIN